jgi:hypothetical protein
VVDTGSTTFKYWVGTSRHDIIAELITFIREQYCERVSIKRVRELRIKIQNETRIINSRTVHPKLGLDYENHKILIRYAKP